jgi:hypothetical protein
MHLPSPIRLHGVHRDSLTFNCTVGCMYDKQAASGKLPSSSTAVCLRLALLFTPQLMKGICYVNAEYRVSLQVAAENSVLPGCDAASLGSLFPNFPRHVVLILRGPTGSRRFLRHPALENEGNPPPPGNFGNKFPSDSASYPKRKYISYTSPYRPLELQKSATFSLFSQRQQRYATQAGVCALGTGCKVDQFYIRVHYTVPIMDT